MSAYKNYWLTWLVLLFVTLGMIFVGTSSVSKWFLLPLLLAAMLVKAGLIGGNFMHLRKERLALVLIVTLGTLLVGVALFAGIAPDGARIFELSRH